MSGRRLLVTGVVVGILAAGAGYGIHRLATGGRVTEVGVDAAVDHFREAVATSGMSATTAAASTTSATTAVARTTSPTTATTATPASAVPTAPLPAPGVYTYATEGYDEVDVLSGARHDYPDVTTMTITPHGCGVRLRWDVAEERWDTWDWCPDPAGVRLVASTSYHEFFGVAGVNEYACSGDPRPLDADPGTTWTTVCRVGDSDTSTMRGTVIERTAIDVGGVSAPALHLRYDVDVAGLSTGTQTIEGWYHTGDGLPLREIFAVNTEQDSPLGVAAFEERSSIELLSLTPRT